MKNLSYLIALLLIFLICGSTLACETELPEETNIELEIYP